MTELSDGFDTFPSVIAKIDLKIAEHIIKIFYSICKNSNALHLDIRCRNGREPRLQTCFSEGVSQTYAQLLYVALESAISMCIF